VTRDATTTRRGGGAPPARSALLPAAGAHPFFVADARDLHCRLVS